MLENLGIQYFVIIVNRNDKKKYCELAKEYHAFGIQVMYAKGSYEASILSKAFGLNVERKKVFITCLLHKNDAIRLIETLNNVYHFDKPNTGVAYSINIESVGY